MIIFKELRWGNAFSYGPNNFVRFDQSPLVQILGKNGHGKSSIPSILEEVLFNTNSKKIKKGDVLNRYTKDKNYWIELDFHKDGNDYSIRTVRTSSSGTVVLTCNGNDISSHTATGTYKSIENILGYDHKTFSQIVYQSSVTSLEFLTATDTARKKFLIELLNLGAYTKAAEVFKEQASALSKQVDVTQAKVNTISSWLAKYTKEDLSEKPVVVVPANDNSIVSRIAELKVSLAGAENTNRRIANNNTYKDVLSKLAAPVVVDLPNKNELTGYQTRIVDISREISQGEKFVKQCAAPKGSCPTCGTEIDKSKEYELTKSFLEVKDSLNSTMKVLVERVSDFEKRDREYKVYRHQVAEIEKYTALYDPTLETELVDKDSVSIEIKALEAAATKLEKEILEATKANKLASDHNSKVAVIKSQIVDMRSDLQEQQKVLAAYTSELSDLQVLVKAFSTTGLVAYKIECLVKDLEATTNEYLATLAGGRFQIGFQINSSDKLNVVITDNGRDIDISALSSGERARVNVASLLAIRRLMQSLSNSRTNLLILDETIENLDAEGKEKLIEVLLAEESLNTFLISHGFSHPLLEKLQVIKENNVSRIE